MTAGVNYIGIATPFYCHDGQGNFLFHKRSKNCRDEVGRWDTGSGQLERGLTLEENVKKELFEEYGVLGKIDGQLPAHSIFRKENGKQTHWIVIPFFIKVNPHKVKINEPKKIDEIGWFTLNRLPNPLHSGFKFTFTKYRQYFNSFSYPQK